jgi:hypothetical protein
MRVPGAKKYFAGRSVSTGVVRYADLAYALGTNDKRAQAREPHTIIYLFDAGEVGGLELTWMACSATVCKLPEERLIVLGEVGFVQALGAGASIEEQPVSDGELSPKGRGPLREVRGIAGGRAYAVGTARQAYRRDGPGNWVCIDQTAQTKDMDPTEVSFESIDGFAENDIYAVGWEGEIWHYDGSRWSPIESPTNLALYKVRCAGDGYVYAAGQSGTVIRGRAEDWEVISPDTTNEDIWGLEWFDGSLYVSTVHLIYRLDGDELVRVVFGSDIPRTCYHLSAADGVMWSFGAKDIMAFDGTSWSRVV